MTEKIGLLANNQINELCPDMKSSKKWLQQNKILSSTRICSQGHEINLQLSEKFLDGDVEKRVVPKLTAYEKTLFWKLPVYHLTILFFSSIHGPMSSPVLNFAKQSFKWAIIRPLIGILL